MNYFLMLVIIGLGCGGYYEYNTLQNKVTSADAQVADLGSQVAKLQALDTKLTADNKQLTKSAADAQAATADMTKQLQDAQTALAGAKQKAAAATAVTTSAIPAKPTLGTNDLGTLTTLDGKSYPNATLMKVQATCIVISFTGGITQVPFGVMTPDMQKRFGFDQQTSVELSPDQIAAQEQKRIAAGRTAGN